MKQSYETIALFIRYSDRHHAVPAIAGNCMMMSGSKRFITKSRTCHNWSVNPDMARLLCLKAAKIQI